MKPIKLFFTLILFSFLTIPVFIFAKSSLPAQEEASGAAIPEITSVQLRELLQTHPDDVILVDVRTPGEYEKEHLANAININLFGPGFEREIENLQKNKNIILYCQTGRRSESAGKIMLEAGFEKVSHLKGGIKAWKQNN